MACFCSPTIISITPPCKNGRCLRLATLRIGCDDGPSCGETVQIDLSQYNDVTDGVNVKYVLTQPSYAGFTSVTLTEAGILTFVTDDEITPNLEEQIEYKAYESAGILSATASVYVCSRDECKFVSYDKVNQTCDSCDGTIQDIVDISITEGNPAQLDISLS